MWAFQPGGEEAEEESEDKKEENEEESPAAMANVRQRQFRSRATAHLALLYCSAKLFCHCQFRFLLAKCLKILMLCQLIC
jgi:hypothetical protein